MKVVIAPNALKGSLGAVAAAEAMARGVSTAAGAVDIVRVPVADGGDGLVDVLLAALPGERCTVTVGDPLGRPVEAAYGYLPEKRTALIEMAVASGLALLRDEERDPLAATTFGTGELIRDALARGARHIVVGIGGSATCDGGTGMAAALGVTFRDRGGAAFEPRGGGMLARIGGIDLGTRDVRLHDATVESVCDVDNPLLGATGAARVYGPQKGATPDDVETLEQGLAHLAETIRSDLGGDVAPMPGAGAAGGLGAGLKAFLGAELRPGVDVVLDLVDLDRALAGAALCLTAEGALDNQTAFGKAPAGVARRAQAAGVPCLAVAGGVARDIRELHAAGLDAAVSLCPGPLTLADAMADAAALLQAATEQIVRAFLAGRRTGGEGR